MRRRTTASALAAVALCAGLSAGQPPAPPKAVDPTDALIQKALANDPDVQVARAKLALAEAEVTKARQAAVTRVITLRDTVEQQRQLVARMSEVLALREHTLKLGGGSREDLLAIQEKVAVARAALERAETDLRLLTGDGPKAAATGDTSNSAAALAALLASGADADTQTLARALSYLNRSVGAKGSSGPIPDRIRAALDKTVHFDPNLAATGIDGALQVFRDQAGLDVPVRRSSFPSGALVIDRPGRATLPVGAWFQMLQDSESNKTGVTIYVRDYGLLITERKNAPPDAMTLTEFWRTHRVAAAQPDPKQPAGKTREFAHDKLPAAIKVKAGETVLVTLPVKSADVEDAKLASDNAAITPRLETLNGKAVVAVRSERAGKARVSWDVTDATGRRFTERGREVEFE